MEKVWGRLSIIMDIFQYLYAERFVIEFHVKVKLRNIKSTNLTHIRFNNNYCVLIWVIENSANCVCLQLK